jgi:hypothetical protein
MAAAIAVMCVSITALGQEVLAFLQPVVEFLSAQVGIDLESDLVDEPGPGAVVIDPTSDFEHITGDRPRFTPEFIDIREGSVFEFDPGSAPFFEPTNSAALWAPTGPREIEPTDLPPFLTYTTTLPKDGSQYESGAVLFKILLRENPPARPEGVCDYTVWVYDPTGGGPFQNLPQFPRDPATGSNLAFGVRLTPEGGGVPAAFSLALDEEGEFQPSDTDTRAFIIDDVVALMVPRGAVGELAAVNYHAVCSAEGSRIDPATSGEDQTGLTSVALADAGAVAITETPVTATPTDAATTTSSRLVETAAGTEEVADTDPGFAIWAPAIAGTLLLGTVAYWAYSRRRNPEERAFAAWKRAERALASSEAEAEPLLIACLNARSVLEELVHERMDLCRVWPPACLEESEGNEEGGSAMHFRRMALGELWVDYKEGKIGAEEVEARWRQLNTPEFQARMRETDQAYRETLRQLDSEIASARAERDTACAPANAATAKRETARQGVLEARQSHLETLEEPPLPPVATWVIEDCDKDEPPRLVEDGPTEHLRVNVGFMIAVGRFVGRERNLERGERLILEMEGLLHELQLTSRLNRIRHGGVHAGWTGHEYEPGVYWVTPDGIRVGETDDGLPPMEGSAERPSRMATTDNELTDLPGLIGDHASSRLTGWMTGFDTLTMQRTFFHQLVTTRPYTVWTCRDEAWEQQERVWRVEVGEPHHSRGEVRWFSSESAGRRAQFETEVNRIAWVATGVVTRDLRRLLRWRSEHQTPS